MSAKNLICTILPNFKVFLWSLNLNLRRYCYEILHASLNPNWNIDMFVRRGTFSSLRNRKEAPMLTSSGSVESPAASPWLTALHNTFGAGNMDSQIQQRSSNRQAHQVHHHHHWWGREASQSWEAFSYHSSRQSSREQAEKGSQDSKA